MNYFVRAQNFATASENRIHSDDVARRLGFHGALVPGVTVYGYLVHPLVERFGVDWLSHSVADLRLHKPTYDGEQVRVTMQESGNEFVVDSFNAADERQATLRSQMPDRLPAPEDPQLYDGEMKLPGRVEIEWRAVIEKQVFAPWSVTLSADDNARYAREAKDDSVLFADVVHPHLLLSLANTALMNEYVMPTWLHVGSQTRHRALLHVGDTIAVRTVTLKKWRNKGHEFIQVYITFWRGDEITTDILHTAIFKVAA